MALMTMKDLRELAADESHPDDLAIAISDNLLTGDQVKTVFIAETNEGVRSMVFSSVPEKYIREAFELAGATVAISDKDASDTDSE